MYRDTIDDFKSYIIKINLEDDNDEIIEDECIFEDVLTYVNDYYDNMSMNIDKRFFDVNEFIRVLVFDDGYDLYCYKDGEFSVYYDFDKDCGEILCYETKYTTKGKEYNFCKILDDENYYLFKRL